ncbi:MAG: YedE family putative selenium transporter [Desulfuromonadales bacterium]|jgi:YedE family putative selenium metabolism protein|nr:YedE family putative selenium transporter [Desulfuromonadales bacterium]
MSPSLRDRHFWVVVAAGLGLGVLGVLLAVWGNPQNSGICVSCFIENSSGALGLHDNERMQYLRPELIGFVLGSILCASVFREFHSRGGSAPLARLVSGIFLIVGSAVFIGCPIKLFLRLTAGDLSAVAGVFGLIAGVWIGLQGLARGIDLGRTEDERGATGLLVPAGFVLLLVFLLARPAFILFSERGSAAQHAPLMISLLVGLLLGALAQRSRFCITGSVRDSLLMGSRSPLFWGLSAFLVGAFATNLAMDRFTFGLYGQPGAHLEYLWSFLGMLLVGWLSVLIGGCPFRQLIKAGEGDADAGLAVVGMLLGGGLVQSWDIAATAAGVSMPGKLAVLAGLAFVLVISLLFRDRTA